MRRLIAMSSALLIGFAGLALAQDPVMETPADDATTQPWAGGDTEAGESYFTETCQNCHDGPEEVVAGIPSSEWLWGFLATHFAADETDRANVVVFLLPEEGAETVQIPEGNVADGEMAFARNCVECHVSSVRLAREVAGDTAEDRALMLWTFLAAHDAPDDIERADIIAFLLAD